MTRRTVQVLILGAVVFLPLLVLAQTSYPSGGLVPCGAVSYVVGTNTYLGASECNFCFLAQLIQNIVNFLIMVAIPISVAMFAWAGIKFFTSAGNPKAIGQAKKIFSSVFIGFLIAISGWLVVQVVLQTITKSSFYSASSWTSVGQCAQLSTNANRPRDYDINTLLGGSSLQSIVPTGGSGVPGAGGATGGGGGDTTNIAAAVAQLQSSCQQGDSASCDQLSTPGGVIAVAAAAYQGASTSAGPGGGNVACAWAVDNVLKGAGLSPLANDANVQTMENSLTTGGRGMAITNQSSAQPGDIVIQGNDGHVGICQNAGCTSVLSNSSSNASFTNVTNVNFNRTDVGQSRIYRVTS